MTDNPKRILIIGNPNSVFIREQVERILVGQSITVVGRSNTTYRDFYEGKCQIITAEESPFRSIPKVRVHAFHGYVKKKLKDENFDLLHIHQVSPDSLRFFNEFKDSAKKTVITFYGSDLLRATEERLKSYEKELDVCDAITLPSDIMEKRFHQVYGNKYDAKINRIRLEGSGLEPVREILADEGQEALKISKEYYEIDPEAITIAIGYNGTVAQSHIPVINALKSSPLAEDDLADKVLLMLQLTYGLPDTNYLNDIEKALRDSPFRYKVFTKYMNGEESARFRFATDIFVHAQPTDAFSASLREHIAAGSVVITPKNINYSEYLEAGIEYEGFDNIEEIPEIIIERIKGQSLREWANSERMFRLMDSTGYVEKWKEVLID